MARVADLLHGGRVNQSEISRIRDVLMFEPPELGKRLVRFGALLILASGIAGYGLLGDSVATVIGAMIVAPLMLPIMGLAFAISIGDHRGIVSSIAVGVAGMATAVLVGFLVGLTTSSAFDPTSNAQIMARTAPRLVDLAAALVTGLAGAFAIGRKDVSDTLPGVAIAISLVPPLANVGILLAAGRPDLAWGSLLLFLTNYFAILITGALVFALMGYPGISLVPRSVGSRRIAIAVVIIMVILVAVPLYLTGRTVIESSLAESRAAAAVRTWVAGSDYKYVSAEDREETVYVIITGNGPVPPPQSLEDSLNGQLYGRTVQVNAVPSESLAFDTAASGD